MWTHDNLLVIWVALFWLASNFVTNDYLIWAPLALYLLHTLLIIGLIVRVAIARTKGRARVA